MRHSSYERSSFPIGMILAVLLLVIVAGVAGGVLWLGSGDTPPPSSAVEKVIPNDHFKG